MKKIEEAMAGLEAIATTNTEHAVIVFVCGALAEIVDRHGGDHRLHAEIPDGDYIYRLTFERIS